MIHFDLIRILSSMSFQEMTDHKLQNYKYIKQASFEANFLYFFLKLMFEGHLH